MVAGLYRERTLVSLVLYYIIRPCTLIYYKYTVVDVQLVRLSENSDVLFSEEVSSVNVNFTANITSAILIPYAVVTERSATSGIQNFCVQVI